MYIKLYTCSETSDGTFLRHYESKVLQQMHKQFKHKHVIWLNLVLQRYNSSEREAISKHALAWGTVIVLIDSKSFSKQLQPLNHVMRKNKKSVHWYIFIFRDFWAHLFRGSSCCRLRLLPLWCVFIWFLIGQFSRDL